LRTLQTQHGIKTNHLHPVQKLYTDAAGRVVIPAESNVTEEIIAICHQGDHFHRSMTNTIVAFREHFNLQDKNVKEEEEFIRERYRRCLSCIKTRYGTTVPRPQWYMAYVTRPFEYIHIDFMELSKAADGKVWLLIITDDFSLTTVLHPCVSPNTEAVVTALLERWLPYYPDPDILHTDGGSHFDNAVLEALAKARGWK
jgi:hypothetical protein